MKVIWKGSIAFGLVNIPIELYTTTESHALSFTLLHATCKTPLKYHRWCPHCKKDVSWHETVKGFKKNDGSYLIVTQEMLHQLQPTKTEQISIIGFISPDKIDPLYLNNHYYVTSIKEPKSYALFCKALKKTDKVALGQFVMRDKEYLVMIQPYDEYLLLTTLHYAYEIRAINQLAFTKKVTTTAQELKLAQEFIKALTLSTFNSKKYVNTFEHAIKELAKKKSKKGTRALVAKAAKIKVPKKSSLVESLTATIHQIKSPSRRPAAYAKKR